MTSPPGGSRRIEVRLRELSQLFDSLDPSPFFEKDLDPKAEDYIVDSFRELSPGAVSELVVHLDTPPAHSDTERTIGDAIRDHFDRRASHLQRELRRLLRRGLVSLGIGLLFLATIFLISEGVGRWLGSTGLAALLHQGLLIVGWVAMWRPLEIFLYDWWPILGMRRLFQHLSRTPVRLVVSRPPQHS